MMRLTASLSVVLAITLHAIPLLAQPLAAKKIPTSGVSLPRVNDLQSSSLSTKSPLSDSRFIVKGFNEYIYPLEHTNIVLTIKFGASLNRDPLSLFLDLTEDVVAEAIVNFGGETNLPMNLIEWDFGENLSLVAASSQSLHHRLTWSVTEDAITGLQHFLVDQKRYRAASGRVGSADGDKALLGYVDVRRRSRPPHAEAVRSLPILPLRGNRNL
ncbi:MAG: hypothetical protein Q9223_001742 [Gallowayella weberi]